MVNIHIIYVLSLVLTGRPGLPSLPGCPGLPGFPCSNNMTFHTDIAQLAIMFSKYPLVVFL